MSQKRNEYLAAAFLGLLLLGVSVLLFEPLPRYPNALWVRLAHELIGLGGGLTCLGILLTGWSKGQKPTLELWRQMSWAQKSLAWLCCALALRSAATLLLMPFPNAALLTGITLALQISGGAALALLIIQVFVKAYGDYFMDFHSRPQREKWERLFAAGLTPAWGIWLVISLFGSLYAQDDTASAWNYARHLSLLPVALTLGGLSIVKLPEKKLKWTMGAAVSILLMAYALYKLGSLP